MYKSVGSVPESESEDPDKHAQIFQISNKVQEQTTTNLNFDENSNLLEPLSVPLLQKSSDNNKSNSTLPPRKYPWPWDAKYYDDMYITEYWTLEGYAAVTKFKSNSELEPYLDEEEEEMMRILSDRTILGWWRKDRYARQNTSKYSIMSSFCACFLFSLAECFLG